VQARQESDALYTLRDFTIHEDSPETPRHFGHLQAPNRTAPSDHKSQSEHDWAYAKRALTAVTIPRSSSSASRTTAVTKNIPATHGTRWRKRKRNCDVAQAT